MVDINDEMWYTNGTKYDSGIENTPSSQGRVRRAVVNRLVNADFSSGWTQTKAYSSDTYALDSSVTCLAMKSAKVVKKGAGEFKSTSQAKLFKSGNYTFFAYVKTTGLTVPDGKKGAFLRVTDGANVYESEAVRDTTAARDFTYVKNFQGDIVGILDASGDLVVEYMYDAWGDAVSIYSASTTIDALAFDNPFRYRGYVWDEETGLYYLRSRYYDPEWGRFINSDSQCGRVAEHISHNLFAYCANSPILHVDLDGQVWVMGAYAPFYGYYHRKVVNWIAQNNPSIGKDVFVGTGFIDLYNKDTYEMYEVKPDRPIAIATGLLQLERYKAGTKPAEYGVTPLILPPDGALDETFLNTTVKVTVTQSGPMIVYSLKVERKKKSNKNGFSNSSTFSHSREEK